MYKKEKIDTYVVHRYASAPLMTIRIISLFAIIICAVAAIFMFSDMEDTAGYVLVGAAIALLLIARLAKSLMRIAEYFDVLFTEKKEALGKEIEFD